MGAIKHVCVNYPNLLTQDAQRKKKKKVHIHNTGMITENATVHPDHRMMETV